MAHNYITKGFRHSSPNVFIVANGCGSNATSLHEHI